MTSANEYAAKGKKYSELAAKGADKLVAYQKEANKLHDAGETLSEMQEFAVGLKWAGKLSMGLGAISIGFTAVSAFLPVKSTEEKILEGVTEIKAQVESLRYHLDLIVKELRTQLDQDMIDILMEITHFSNIKTASDYMASAAARRADPSIGSAQDQVLAPHRTMTTHCGISPAVWARL